MVDLFAHLEAYVAVAEERSFSRAADLLHIAQPVLSRRIKVLEKHFGGTLFDRTHRQITSTELGVLLLPHAKDVLSRADRLTQVAREALAPTAYTLGVPTDCDPAALARVLRAAAERGITVGVRELPAAERDAGSLAFALLRVPPERARLRVPMGLSGAVPASRRVHLESLRPRRGDSAVAPPILVTAEDTASFAIDRIRTAAARAGLPAARVRTVGATGSAVAQALAGHALLLCPEPYARRHGLPWSPLADPSLDRGYDLAGRDTDWLEPLLAEAVGAVRTAVPRPAAVHKPVDTDDRRTRLAASG
ncbi:LysR family transcriptional regulator [Fodinicola feengrottensis]|uniref:LysR family transcriptional regulator n=1 Tax=Fodinicola feengrottensis TaxID=435914 RepID=A0ABP4SEY2_9ACTN